MSTDHEILTLDVHNGKTVQSHGTRSESIGVNAMNREPLERLMEVILQMRINLQQVTITFQQQTEEIRQQLGFVFDEEKKVLEVCLERIDDKLEECATYVEDYRKLYASLDVMRQKLVQLGAEPTAMPTPLPLEHFEDIIAWRVQELRTTGKV